MVLSSSSHRLRGGRLRELCNTDNARVSNSNKDNHHQYIDEHAEP